MVLFARPRRFRTAAPTAMRVEGLLDRDLLDEEQLV